MNFCRSDDPERDFKRHQAQQEAWLENLPECARCGHPIQNEDCYDFDGEYVCPDCIWEYVDEHFKVQTPNYED